MFGFFVSSAYAMGVNPQSGSAATEAPWYANPLVMITLMMVAFYFFLWYPQRKEQKKHQERLKNLKAGDKVILTGGIHGVIANAAGDPIKIKIAENVKIDVSRSAVISVTSSGEESVATDKTSDKK